ncbi:MAG: hypothetical protein WCF84_07145, partial [Anaerolineae bacterium]
VSTTFDANTTAATKKVKEYQVLLDAAKKPIKTEVDLVFGAGWNAAWNSFAKLENALPLTIQQVLNIQIGSQGSGSATGSIGLPMADLPEMGGGGAGQGTSQAGSKGAPIAAAQGYAGWVTSATHFVAGEGSEPEYVNITPRSKARAGGSGGGGNGGGGGRPLLDLRGAHFIGAGPEAATFIMRMIAPMLGQMQSATAREAVNLDALYGGAGG